MQITVKFFANFREITGRDRVTMSDVSTIKDVLDRLVEEFGGKLSELFFDEGGKLRNTVNILINGRTIALMEGVDTKVNDGDSVAIFPPVSGGWNQVL